MNGALSVSELATLLGLGRSAAYELLKSGSLQYMRIGGAIRLDPHTVANWLRAQTVGRAA